MATLVAEYGFRAVTLDQVLLRADLDHAAFSRHFERLDQCFATIWSEVDNELAARMTAAFQAWTNWQDRLRAALLAGLVYMASEPDRARLYIDEAVYVDDALRDRQQAALSRLSEMIACGHEGDSDRGTRYISEAICGAIWHRIQHYLRTGRGRDLPAEVPQLMYFAVLPYRGTDAAEAELRRPLPR